jgi:ribonuclease HI
MKPKMIHWSYMAIIRPIISYAALVWWPKTKQKAAQALLLKIQRLACLSITGAMKTCPTAAMEALLDLLPLHLQLKKEALLSAIRLHRTEKWKPGNLVGHLEIMEDLYESLATKEMSDFMVKKLDLDKTFKVVLTDRNQGNPNRPINEGKYLTWYTDGSKTKKGVGVGVFGPHLRLYRPLGVSPTIFQAEIHAIELCAKHCMKRRIRGANILIISDSQASLKALNSYYIESKLVWECLSSIKLLATQNRVTLMWVPGHEGTAGNEMADKLAKKGSQLPFIGPEPYCGVGKSHLMEEVKLWEDNHKSVYWTNSPGMRIGKKFIEYSSKRAKEVLSLNKAELRELTGLLTGHFSLRYHLNKIGKAITAECRFCGIDNETTEHIICECSAIARQRLEHLGYGLIAPPKVKHLAARKILDFYRCLKIE